MEVKSAPPRRPVRSPTTSSTSRHGPRALRRGRADAAGGGGRGLGGRLPAETIAEVKREAIAAGLAGGLHAVEHGGQGWTRVEWALVEEQYGRTTNAIHWHVPQAYNVWAHASEEHVDRYLRPALRGELKDAYAVTERDAGSDPSAIAATAERTDAGFRLNGEKWFVTGGDHAAVYVVMANLVDGARPAAHPVRGRRRARRDRGRRRPALHPQLPRRPSDHPVHGRRGRASPT